MTPRGPGLERRGLRWLLLLARFAGFQHHLAGLPEHFGGRLLEQRQAALHHAGPIGGHAHHGPLVIKANQLPLLRQQHARGGSSKLARICCQRLLRSRLAAAGAGLEQPRALVLCWPLGQGLLPAQLQERAPERLRQQVQVELAGAGA